jgi:sialic acid synthase SpsE
MTARTFRIGEREVGGGRCFLIAEAGVNHNGDVGLAGKLVDVAAQSGRTR